jgi:flagellar protein FlaG
MDDIAGINAKFTTPGSAAQFSRPRIEPSRADPVSGPQPPRSPQRQEPIQADAVVQNLKEFASLHNISLDFSVHEASGRTVIRVIDTGTRKVVREIPPEEILDLLVSIEKMAGKLLSTTA